MLFRSRRQHIEGGIQNFLRVSAEFVAEFLQQRPDLFQIRRLCFFCAHLGRQVKGQLLHPKKHLSAVHAGAAETSHQRQSHGIVNSENYNDSIR